MNKYKAKRTTINGTTYDSKREAAYAQDLKILERAGEISQVEAHPQFAINVNDIFITRYTADFRFYDKLLGRTRVIDVKSPPTAKRREFQMVKKLMQAVHGIEVEVVY